MPSHFNLTGALLVLGLGEIDVSPVGPTPQYENARCPLNEEQERAISAAFRSLLSIVAAPAVLPAPAPLEKTVFVSSCSDLSQLGASGNPGAVHRSTTVLARTARKQPDYRTVAPV
jgi:hypothetical protein